MPVESPAANRQPNRVGSIGLATVFPIRGLRPHKIEGPFKKQSRLRASRWQLHRDWDSIAATFGMANWWAWYGGSWLGLDAGFYPWDLYDYGYYPYDYYGGNPMITPAINPDDYNDPSSYVASAQSPNNDTMSGSSIATCQTGLLQRRN